MDGTLANALVWIGVVFCLSQSAMFSGLNLAFFSLSRLELEIASNGGDQAATRVLTMRRDASFLLTTILWGNVGINVLLTLLLGSVFAGLFAFVLSTVMITFGGEILPQAYSSRHALKTASLLAPLLRSSRSSCGRLPGLRRDCSMCFSDPSAWSTSGRTSCAS